MKDQHEKIAGYRDLSQADIDAMNALKTLESLVDQELERVKVWMDENMPTQAGLRWLSIARTHLETGFMFAIKAVAQPTNGLGRNR